MIKRIDIKEFREFGFLQEINRQYLHPLGMALEVIIDDSGCVTLGGIWDYREDDDGMRFADDTISKEMVDRVEKFRRGKLKTRKQILGYEIQPIKGNS